MCALNEDQRNVVSLALQGHNIFIDGYAGTGKTFLLNTLYNELTKLSKTVAITCTTGIACMNFEQNLGASTIHKWSGLHDGRYNSNEVLAVVSNNETTMNRIQQTDTLIIDEISMLSCKLFDQLQCICSLKDNSKPWGGVQIIVAGDFNQLPPTPNKAYNDDGQFCFKSVYFKNFHKLTLNTVIRQNDRQFIDMIRKVSTGVNLSEDVFHYIKTFEKPFTCDSKKSVKLFSKNELVNMYNRKELMGQPGPVYEYLSTDTGDPSRLQNVRAPRILWLKENCPVILIRNLSTTLVNGLQGTVVKCEPDGAVVEFTSINRTLKIKKISFSVFSPRQNRTVANREQIPLLLSYALTIHKAQGMTLDRVEVDCREIFQPGQLGVAIGRVRSENDLRVINFNPKICFPQPEDIQMFKEEPSLMVNDDLSCCRISHRVDTVVTVDDFWIEDDPVFEDEPQEDFDEQFNEILSHLDFSDTYESIEIPTDFDICKILKDCITESPVSPIQYEVNQLVNNILGGDLHNAKIFCRQQFLEFSKIVNDLDVTENVPVKADKLNHLYAECHKYQTSDNYKLACMLFFKNFSPATNAHSNICTKITSAVRQYLLHEKADVFTVSERQTYDRKVTVASKARIRYVGGYCVHEVKKKYNSQFKADMYSTSIEGQTSFHIAEERLNILNSLVEREDTLRHTSEDPQSLIDIERRQYMSHGLLNITDDVYNFFCEACKLSIQYLIDKHFNVHGEQLHSFCLQEMLNNLELFESFVKVVGKNRHHFDEFSTSATLQSVESVVSSVIMDTLSSVQHANDLYKELIEKFLLVMLGQFRNDLLDSFSVAKTMAHRKQIQTKKQKQSLSTKYVSFQTVLDDKTTQKEMSHALLKGLLLSSSEFLSTMTKKQICILCKAYNVTVKSSEKKPVIAESLRYAILNSTCMPNYQILISESYSETSTVHQYSSKPSTSTEIQPETQPSTSTLIQPETQPSTSTLIQPETQPSTSTLIQPETQPSTSTEIQSETQPSTSTEIQSETSTVHQDGSEPSTSTWSQTQEQTLAGATPEEQSGDDLDDLCEKCQKTGNYGVQWIQCSSCMKWFHRNCAGLRAKKKWQKFSAQGVDYFCNACA